MPGHHPRFFTFPTFLCHEAWSFSFSPRKFALGTATEKMLDEPERLIFVQFIARDLLAGTSRNWHLHHNMGRSSTGDPCAGALFAGWWGAARVGVSFRFWKNSDWGVPSRFPRIRCKKRCWKKHQITQVTPQILQKSLTFTPRLAYFWGKVMPHGR